MSDVDYCDCDYDGDPPEFSKVQTITARKQFKCDECAGPILPRERYQRIVGKWEGDLMTFRECHLCLELREWAKISMPCFCAYEIGTLHARVRSMVKDVAPKTPGFFMEYGRRMVTIRKRRDAKETEAC